MQTKNIEEKFKLMGAHLRVDKSRSWGGFKVDVRGSDRFKSFELRISPELENSLEVSVTDVQPEKRHLLLQVKDNSVKRGNKARIDRFLCGHDERDWFVAAVPGSATTVKQAMENLMPPQVRAAALKSGLKLDDKFTRRNKAFLRQGEWFFIPHPDKQVQNKDILKNEPIRRGRGKPHMVQELYRNGGETVFVCARHPNGLTPVQQSELFNRNPSARLWLWRSMVRGASVYARGRVSHSDHATIVLPCWHEVVMNTESNSRTMANVAFLD